NPQKNKTFYEGFWDVFRQHFAKYTKRIKSFDLAFDVPVDMKSLFAISLTGRQKAYYKGTQYFGSSGNTGRLKIYDKKKELEQKQGVTILEDRTRIEYTVRLEEPIVFQWLCKADLTINEDYEVVYLNQEKLTGEIKSAVLAIHHDYMKMNEFTRTTKTKIKKALASMEKLDLDHAYRNAREKIMKSINSYLRQV
ncbi:hypothetical protein OR571_22580, partial [Psychrobacillus sp. NEAU-3TGS]|uniref:hypothetical protein n=1 Tax=Psychrobacillus sp. NEAU-3TGS TaxID=2995412 RepID=UPI0024964B46